MKYRFFPRKMTAAFLACTLCNPAQELTASGYAPTCRPVCYTLTETAGCWYYADENGNPMPEQSAPRRRKAPADLQGLPARYDLREEGYVTPAKSQVGGTCWAYGHIGAIESNMIRKGMAEPTLDLSEAHMIWFGRGQGGPADPSDPLYGDGVNLGTEAYIQGGGLYWVTGPLLAWEGVVRESDAPAHQDRIPMDESLRFRSIAHLQNMRKYSKNDALMIKQTLMEKGALAFSYFIPSNIECMSPQCGFYQTLYVPGDPARSKVEGGGHTVTLVGWDDNFPKENFNETPPGDGAWILKNTWGENASRTEKGFFYMSYYEPGIADISLLDMESPDNYSGIYQYDGDSDTSYTTGHGSDYGFLQANVFTARKDENITAVGFYINNYDVPYEAEIYALEPDFADPRDGRLLTSVSGTADYIGYYTVPLAPGCGVRAGQLFSVVIKTAPCAHTTCHFDRHCFAPRTSFFTVYNADGEEPWKDCYEDGRGNANIKAYTSNGLMLCEALCPDPLIREDLAAEYDTDGDGFLPEDELSAVHGIPYDISGDGRVNAADLTLLKRAVSGKQAAGSGYHWNNGDLDHDRRLTREDIDRMQYFLLRKPETA